MDSNQGTGCRGEGHGLDRRTGRTAEEAVGGRAVRQPDRRRAWAASRRNAVIGKVHRLGLSGRAKSPSSAAPRPRKARSSGHMLRVSRPHHARQYRARLRLRAGAGTRTGRDPGRAAQDAAAAQREDLPLADRRSGQPGLLLLRRRNRQRPALLLLSLAASPISRPPTAAATSARSGAERAPRRSHRHGRASARPFCFAISARCPRDRTSRANSPRMR